jgi:hypothetical protein
MIKDLDDLKSVLSKFAEKEPKRAKLLRLQGEDEGLELESTGAFVVVGQSDGKPYTEIRGLEGELPANIRIEEDAVLGSSMEEPDEWQTLDGPDGDSLRTFSLLNPQILGELIESAEFHDGDDEQTVILGRVNLASIPRIPEAFIKWLGADAFDRPVELRVKDNRLIEVTQPDLHPRRSDHIIERFED